MPLPDHISQPIDFLELWYQALANPPGKSIVITGSRRTFRDRLYKARAASGDPELHKVSLVLSAANPQEIILVHKVVEVPDET